MTGQYMSGARNIEYPGRAQGAGRAPSAHHRGVRQQSAARLARSAGRPADLRDRRVRFGQVDADQRHAVPRGRASPVWLGHRAGAVRIDRRAGALRQGHQRRPVADRPHAALESGHLHGPLHADPRTLRGRARLEGTRLRTRPLLVQREGRPLRGLPGRRRAEGGDALFAGRLRSLRRLPRQALQPRNARHPVQRQEHQRSARHDGGERATSSSSRCRSSRAS